MEFALGPRSRGAVQELEALQQSERAGAGEPALTPEDFLRLFKDNLQGDIIAAQLRSGGLNAAESGISRDRSQSVAAPKKPSSARWFSTSWIWDECSAE